MNRLTTSACHLNLTIDPTMAPPSHEQAKLLRRQLVLNGMVDRIAN